MSAPKIYSVQADGKEYQFSITHNFAEPCPCCGIPACGKEDILWFENGAKRIGIVYDGGVFDVILQKSLNLLQQMNRFSEIAQFLQDWNKCEGWADDLGYEGYKLDPLDFLEAMKVIAVANLGTSTQKESDAYTKEMKALAETAIQQGFALKIARS